MLLTTSIIKLFEVNEELEVELIVTSVTLIVTLVTESLLVKTTRFEELYLKAVFEVPMYHMSHKNHLPQGGDVNNLHQVAETKTPKYNDPWDWVENFTTSQNSDDWGLGNIEIEFETI